MSYDGPTLIAGVRVRGHSGQDREFCRYRVEGGTPKKVRFVYMCVAHIVQKTNLLACQFCSRLARIL